MGTVPHNSIRIRPGKVQSYSAFPELVNQHIGPISPAVPSDPCLRTEENNPLSWLVTRSPPGPVWWSRTVHSPLSVVTGSR